VNKHRATPAKIREYIRQVVYLITGQKLTSRRIRLYQNPYADSRIAFDLATRKIYWIGIGSTYWKGPFEVLRAVSVHEAMNTRLEYEVAENDLLEAEEIAQAGDDTELRVAIRTKYEIDLRGWVRIRKRKLQADQLALEWYYENNFDLVPYIQFLIEEWNAAQQFSEPRRRYHRIIGAKRVRDAGIFFENCVNHKDA